MASVHGSSGLGVHVGSAGCIKLRQIPIQRVRAVAVVDDDEVAVARELIGVGDRAFVDGPHRSIAVSS